jgi:hypothetical protein
MVEGSEVKLAEGTGEVGSEGMSEVEAKGLGGPVAGEDNVMGGADLLARDVRALRGIGHREETLNSGRA